MKFRTRIDSGAIRHGITRSTDDHSHSLRIAPKPSGFGSSANGTALLFPAPATCYGNDIYREAAARTFRVERVMIDVKGEAQGTALANLGHRATVAACASEKDILDLMRRTNRVAEVQNTLRAGASVVLRGAAAASL